MVFVGELPLAGPHAAGSWSSGSRPRGLSVAPLDVRKGVPLGELLDVHPPAAQLDRLEDDAAVEERLPGHADADVPGRQEGR
jgi:hypothetical protein